MELGLEVLGFLLTALVMIIEGIAVVMSRRPMHSILFLFLLLLTAAALFIELDAVVLALAELLIYNGGITILLTLAASIEPEEIRAPRIKPDIILPLVAAVILVFMISTYKFGNVSNFSYTSLGTFILSGYGILLLVVMVMSIAAALSATYMISKEDVGI